MGVFLVAFAVPSNAPLEVQARAQSSTSFTVTWQLLDRRHVNGVLLGYIVDYENPSGIVSRIRLSASENWLLVEKLEEFTEYTVAVCGFTSKGKGPANSPVKVRTLEDSKFYELTA